MKSNITTDEVGKFGEKICAKHLKKQGYKILERNLRINRLEIDIIAASKTHILFVEVKTRRTDMNNIFRPADAVGKSKRDNLISFAKAYTKGLTKKYESRQLRIDVCEVLTHGEEGNLKVDSINYIENAVSR